MAVSRQVTKLIVENFVFPPQIKAPGSDNTFFLAGAGERGRSDLEGRYVKYTAIGVYLEDSAIPALAPKWKGKSADDLAASADFFRDIITGPFEKFTQVTMLQPLTGQQYSVNMARTFVERWKSMGIYNDEIAKAVDIYLKAFDDKKFSPGESILFTQSPTGKFTMAFSKHDAIPKEGEAEAQNKTLPEEILSSIIGENGVCPGAKQTLAARVYRLLNDVPFSENENPETPTVSVVTV